MEYYVSFHMAMRVNVYLFERKGFSNLLSGDSSLSFERISVFGSS